MNEKIEIRRAEASDIPAVKQCARAAYEKYVERIGRQPAPMVADFTALTGNNQLHVLIINEQLGGYVVCYSASDCYFLENIAVDPQYQCCGYGADLLQYVETLAAGFDMIRLYTNEKMVENLSWYVKHGYVETERRVEAGFSRVYFEKRLHRTA